jgi:uncharacterized protein (DUF433 family)
MTADLGAREVAELSGASRRTVEEAVEERIIRPVAAPGRRGRRLLVGKLKVRLDLASKCRLATRLATLGPDAVAGARFELEPALEMNLGRLIGDTLARAERYRAARDALIAVDKEILGGTPVIRGARISVYSLLGRVDRGDTARDILADNPDIAPEAMEAAIIYARSHPLLGRPGGRPWITDA